MTLPLIALIGLDPPLEEAVRHSMYGQARFLTYPMPPQGYSLDGQMRLEHPRLENLWAEPAGVIYHGYFDDVTDFRKALALSSTPCYPAMAPTLPHDDRAASLALARWIDKQEDQVGRGFVPVIAGEPPFCAIPWASVGVATVGRTRSASRRELRRTAPSSSSPSLTESPSASSI